MFLIDGARTVFRSTLLAVLIFGGSTSAWAGELSAPQGKVLLTISGKISTANDGQAATLDRNHLKALPQHSLKTSNPFVQGEHRFEGVLLADVLDLVGASGDLLTARALDGYTVDIPVSDVRRFSVLLATKIDGNVMRVRTKGPIWLIYPVDQFEELQAEHYSSRSIWQLTTLTVK